MPTKPPRLNFGDTIALVAPASPPADATAVDHSVAALEKIGFKVKLARHARERRGFLAGSDRERAADLIDAFSDRRVKAIICLRGGYGTARLLPLLNYELIRRNPKIFIGFSDVTSLHCSFLKKSGLISFHGPMAASHFIRKEFPDFTLRSFLKTLMEPEPPGGIRQGYEGKTIRVLRRGLVSGPLIGGNLSVLCALLGTTFQPAFKGRILFLEDLDEPPYRIDRMLTHLINAGALKQVAGIAAGLCQNCEDPKAATAGEYRQSLQDVLKERLRSLNVPVVIGLPFGHVPHNATLPVGARATLDAGKGDLIISGAAVV